VRIFQHQIAIAWKKLPAGRSSPAPTIAEDLHRCPLWPDFGALGTNKDGAISKDEAAVHVGLTEAFSTSDLDQNGQLTAAEYAEAQSRLSK